MDTDATDPRIVTLPAAGSGPTEPPLDALPAAAGPFALPDYQKVVAARENDSAPRLFSLVFTAEEAFDIQAKRLNLSERAQIGDLPTAMQDRVVQFFDKINRAVQQDRRMTLERAMRNLADTEDRNNLYCLLGFIEPRLVERDEDADPERGVWPMSAIHLRDRQRFFEACNGNDEAAARQFRPIPRG